ncbi:hypothetical protein MIND_00347700 [Mycena indigotica]|uniref:Carbohydrate-binding module family 19 domain-containing protein n=1 Tax=Mycena indigotica TaxID=2126181 RepID=A0A8H6WER9_9AGAR|nr:uncharacterized protein MIND_00347700 [Mycena indigotica]KAF7309759.1 hypothetical protein MIND_00347700 [Mycena indigotica]
MIPLVIFSAALMAHSAPLLSRDFRLQNGLDAQKLNAKFKTLTNSTECTDGEQACIGVSFAQCVAGNFQLSPCSGGTICAALPLVNKAGTSITCDTASDVADRIAQTGATGGVDGSDPTPTTTSSPVANSTSDFLLQNGLDSQKLNTKFASLTADSPCSDDERACIGTATGLCLNGSFVVFPCSTGTVCAALPSLTEPGTFVTCDAPDDIKNRIDQTGATGGIDGSESSTSSVAASSPMASSSDFRLQNGLDAQRLNAQFATLDVSASCSDGEQACIGDAFAQCVAGSFGDDTLRWWSCLCCASACKQAGNEYSM